MLYRLIERYGSAGSYRFCVRAFASLPEVECAAARSPVDFVIETDSGVLNYAIAP